MEARTANILNRFHDPKWNPNTFFAIYYAVVYDYIASESFLIRQSEIVWC